MASTPTMSATKRAIRRCRNAAPTKWRDILMSEGVAASRLTSVGYGDKKPIASNDHEEGRGENRRIEFILK